MDLEKIANRLEVHKNLIKDQTTEAAIKSLMPKEWRDGSYRHYSDNLDHAITLIAYAESEHRLKLRLDEDIEKKKKLLEAVAKQQMRALEESE
jgi:hypothetical protein